MASRALLGMAVIVGAMALGGGGCRCSKAPDAETADAAQASDQGRPPPPRPFEVAGFSAPIAAARGEGGDVFVAGLDVPARAVRVQRITAKDEVVADRTVLAGVTWSSESELKLVPAAGGVAVTWRGLREGKRVRQHIVLGADLAPRGEPVTVATVSCATRDALWFSDGKRVHGHPFAGTAVKKDLPNEKEVALVCGVHQAFALLDDDEGTSMLPLGGAEPKTAGIGKGGGLLALLKEPPAGDDEQRERAEYTSGDDLGVIRLAASGAVSLREYKDGALSPLRTLKSAIPRDDDVVAVDASPRAAVIVFTEDVAEGCAGSEGTMTRVKALRVDRSTFEESVVELSAGTCGRELGPFFTGALGDAVSVAWVERVAVAGRSRAPIAGLVHRTVPATGSLGALVSTEQAADALVDGGCDGTRCYAAALARREGMDAMVPGVVRVLRY